MRSTTAPALSYQKGKNTDGQRRVFVDADRLADPPLNWRSCPTSSQPHQNRSFATSSSGIPTSTCPVRSLSRSSRSPPQPICCIIGGERIAAANSLLAFPIKLCVLVDRSTVDR
ncbi:hypothetical protein BDA96_10G054900 [Sorghum bicolor]|uniref:Uncharacterized protein n=1 Tax=Sorghum bicolor TaxID=4558 RepID=A0A921TZT4_SORBI|nr:hypothetical protein BDA96_10G054900 [Sorghum bicolor]